MIIAEDMEFELTEEEMTGAIALLIAQQAEDLQEQWQVWLLTGEDDKIRYAEPVALSGPYGCGIPPREVLLGLKEKGYKFFVFVEIDAMKEDKLNYETMLIFVMGAKEMDIEIKNWVRVTKTGCLFRMTDPKNKNHFIYWKDFIETPWKDQVSYQNLQEQGGLS